MTWLLAYSALGLQMVPEESLRENRTIFVSANLPEDMEPFNASRKASVAGIASMVVRWWPSRYIYAMGCSFSRVWRGWTQTRYRVSLIWTTLARSRKRLPLASSPPAGSGRSPILGGEGWTKRFERKFWRVALERTVRWMGALADSSV